jgi:DNA-binding NtrC family response regulator
MVSPPSDARAPPASAYDRGVSEARRVLIVDDDESVRQMLTAFFETTYSAKIVVEAVADGAAAIDAVRRAPPALVVLDIEMPGIDGVTAYHAIRDIHPRLPVIMLTGNESRRTAAELTALGVFSYMPKPVRLTYLEHIVTALFDTRRPWRPTFR